MKTCNGCRRSFPAGQLVAQPGRARPLCVQCSANKTAGLRTCRECFVTRPRSEFKHGGKHPCVVCSPPLTDEQRARRGEWRVAREAEDEEAIARLKRDTALRRTYGITLADFEAMSDLQGGRCGACRKVPGDGVLVVDHDHETGRVRGLLDRCCNAGLGLLGDVYPNVMRAAAYLAAARLSELEEAQRDAAAA